MVQVAAEKFDVTFPPIVRPFEFGMLEITVLLLFAIGIATQYLSRSTRERLRWASQIAGLLVIGFWANSPVTLAKFAACWRRKVGAPAASGPRKRQMGNVRSNA